MGRGAEVDQWKNPNSLLPQHRKGDRKFVSLSSLGVEFYEPTELETRLAGLPEVHEVPPDPEETGRYLVVMH